MGWWETEDGLTLGDQPLDELHRSLRKVGTSYAAALGRPPTVAELEHLLALVLDSLTPDQVGGLEEVVVSGVMVKTRKGRRKQAYEPGDLFALPLPGGGFGFGRVLWKPQPDRGFAVVEVLARRASVPVTSTDVKDEPRLLAPALLGGDITLGRGLWPIFAHEPGFRAPDHDDIRFTFHGIGGGRITDINREMVQEGLAREDLPTEFTASDQYDPSFEDLPRDLEQALDEAGITAGW